jgi:fluoroacetyl-CoA thioesterase
MRPTLRPGLTARLEYQVPAERTVPYLLPESAEFAALPDVLATGYLVGLVEWCCMRAIGGHVAGGQQTVGVHVDLSHEAPTPPGRTLTVDAELTAVEGRQLTFSVQVMDEATIVCRGRHRRAVIDRARFDRTLSTLTGGRLRTPDDGGI